MKNFYYNTNTKLRGIFSDHCNLNMEQYEVIGGEFLYLEADIQEEEASAEILKRAEKMKIIFDFLYETKELTLKEHADLNEMVSDMLEKGQVAGA